MRIKENRQMSVNFDVQTPGAARIEVKMLKNDFIFGAMVDNMIGKTKLLYKCTKIKYSKSRMVFGNLLKFDSKQYFTHYL